MACYTLCPLTDPRWQQLLEVHESATVFHSPDWLRALQCTYGYEPVVLTTCPPDTNLTNGLLLCSVRNLFGGRRLVSLPFSDHCEPLAGDDSEMWALLAAAASYCSDLGRIHLEIRPLHVLPPSQLGFQPTAAYYIHQLELSESADNVFARFSKGSVQRKITKAEHEDLTCEEGNSQKLIEAFYGLLLLTRRRHRIPPQPIEWFQSLARLLGDAFKVRVAFKSGRPVASIITLQSTQSMVYKYGCSDEAYWNLGGLQLLLWKAIQQAVSHGCKHFDFGRSDVDHIGLVEFKDRWGAKRTLLSYWTTPSTNETRRDAMDSLLARRAFSLVPDRILVVLGRMLYRYIG